MLVVDLSRYNFTTGFAAQKRSKPGKESPIREARNGKPFLRRQYLTGVGLDYYNFAKKFAAQKRIGKQSSNVIYRDYNYEDIIWKNSAKF